MRLAPYTMTRRYARGVHVTSGIDTEIRHTLEAAVDFVNARADGELDVREIFDAHEFTRARSASTAAVDRLDARLGALAPRLLSLPATDADEAAEWVNAELNELAIAPSVTEHDGAALHIHWTPPSATFDDQVLADILMSLAQELCDNGTARFGVCSARECGHLFYDATRNRSRRFCNDPRCASRTHTAEHRRRQRGA